MRTLTNRQARKFLLLKQGLIGTHRFVGKEGALAFVKQAGCIQYDPVDVCGKNAELTLQSRVKGFTKKTLDDLLYEDRTLLDYPDKNLSIIPTEDLPYFTRYREEGRRNAERFPDILPLTEQAREYIEKNGPVNSDELKLDGANETKWRSAIHWSVGSNPARAALEQMYTTGELVIHHKKGTRKFYDLSEKHLPRGVLNAPEPLPDDFDHLKWRVLRRIGAIGLLWDRPSDAWLNIWGFDGAKRAEAFKHLLEDEKIIEVSVEGIRGSLYAHSEDSELLNEAASDSWHKPRCEMLAPLDCFIWDRKLIKAIFGYHYMWEIYTPAVKRVYGHYTLPLIYGDEFVGRVDSAAERKESALNVKNIWYEDGVKATKKLKASVDACIRRFAKFNGCERIKYTN